MPPSGPNGRPVPAMPAPPHGSGFTCFHTSRGREVRGGRTEFVVTDDALLVTWETGWTGRQTRRIPRADVRAVRVEPDRTSSLGRGMRQLVIEYGDGATLAPVRRSRPDRTKWLAERLREALGEVDPTWTPAGAARSATPPADNGGAGKSIAAVGASVDLPTAHQPPDSNPHVAQVSRRPETPLNVSVRGARGRMFIRARSANPFLVHRESRPLLVLLLAMAIVAAMIAMAALGGPVRQVPPALVFGAIALVLVGGNVWVARRLVATTARRYVIVLSRRALRVASVDWPSGRRTRHPPVPRALIVDFAGGWSNEPWPHMSPELHAHLADGERVGYMRGRPIEEHQSVAWHLVRALAKLPVPAAPAGAAVSPGAPATPASGDGMPPVLPYGRPHVSTAVTFDPLPDGVVITIPPVPADQFFRAWPYAFLVMVSPIVILLLGHVLGDFLGVRARFETAALIVSLPIAALLYGLVRAARLRHVPVVISVDGSRLYFYDPGSINGRMSFPRHKVKDVRLTTTHGQHGRKWRTVEVCLRGEESLHMCVNRGEWDRGRVAAALRNALGMQGPPPEHRAP